MNSVRDTVLNAINFDNKTRCGAEPVCIRWTFFLYKWLKIHEWTFRTFSCCILNKNINIALIIHLVRNHIFILTNDKGPRTSKLNVVSRVIYSKWLPNCFKDNLTLKNYLLVIFKIMDLRKVYC